MRLSATDKKAWKKAGGKTACLILVLGLAVAGGATGNEAILDGATAAATLGGKKIEEEVCEE